MIKRFHFSAVAWRSTAAAMTAALVLAGAAAAQTSASSSKNAVPAATGGYSLIDLTIFGGYQWFQFGQGTNAAAVCAAMNPREPMPRAEFRMTISVVTFQLSPQRS